MLTARAAAWVDGDVTQPASCPTWCIAGHPQLAGEEADVHVSVTLIAGGSRVQLCQGTGQRPYLLLDGRETELHVAEALVSALVQLLDEASGRLDVTPAAV